MEDITQHRYNFKDGDTIDRQYLSSAPKGLYTVEQLPRKKEPRNEVIQKGIKLKSKIYILENRMIGPIMIMINKNIVYIDRGLALQVRVTPL